MTATTSDCEQIQRSTCLQLYQLAVAIVPPVVRLPQFEKGCSTYPKNLKVKYILLAELLRFRYGIFFWATLYNRF